MTTPFIPIEEQPHTTAKMFCRSCARVAVHVWPTRTEVQNLECSGCGKVGFLMFHSDVPIRTIRSPGATVTLAEFNALLAERDGLQAQVDALTRAQADLTEQKREISYVCHDQSDRLVALTKALEAARAAIHGEYCGSQHHTQCEAVTAALAGTTKVAASGSRGESVTPKGALAPPLDAAISAERATVDALTAALRELKRGDCWCEVGIGNPNMGGRHSSACRKVAVLLDRTGAGDGGL
jgi:hypothetical protein